LLENLHESNGFGAELLKNMVFEGVIGNEVGICLELDGNTIEIKRFARR
jgi:hypothetical protein